MTDTQRLDWLEKQSGAALISDDYGLWAVSWTGYQNVPTNPGEPDDIEAIFFVEKAAWRPSIREAIDAAMAEETPPTPAITPQQARVTATNA